MDDTGMRLRLLLRISTRLLCAEDESMPICWKSGPKRASPLGTLAARFVGVSRTALVALLAIFACAGSAMAATAPVNDNFANATVIPNNVLPVTVTGSNVGATGEAGEHVVSGLGNTSVWWKWTAPSSGNFIISTTGSTYPAGGAMDTTLAVYQNPSGVSSSYLIQNDDYSPGSNFNSLVAFAATANATYYIQVSSYYGASEEGNIVLNIERQPVVNVVYGPANEGIQGQAAVTLTFSNPVVDIIPVSLSLGGTAVNGTDYASASTLPYVPGGVMTYPVVVPTFNGPSPTGKTASVTVNASPYLDYQIGTISSGTAIYVNPSPIYVNNAATGSNNGTSWANAYTTVQAALTAATSGSQIWVAQGNGNYTPGTTNTATFTMKTGVAVYGGFAGTESTIAQRSISQHPTVLSGDIGTLGLETDNCQHVVTFNSAGGSLDGFIIRDGYGGSADGGGVYVPPGTFSGGSVRNCIITHNSAQRGAGIAIQANFLNVDNCLFAYNNTTVNSGSWGGGMWINTSAQTTILTNDAFIGNISCSNADGGGVALESNANGIGFINCTFTGNEASNGAAIWDSGSAYTTTLVNDLFWNNATPSGPFLGTSSGGVDFVANSCDIQGGLPSTVTASPLGTNIAQDPLFLNPGNPAGDDGLYLTADDGLALTTGSPCAAGAGFSAGLATDIRGVARTSGQFGIGAYQGTTTPSVIYVNAAATGGNNGTSWANAYTDLQSALAAAVSGQEIWVAKGTYKPTSTTTRTISYVMKTGVAVYGGFAGTEGALSQRSITGNPTILSGDIGTIGTYTDDSYNVVTFNSAGGILDGFTIRDGYANGGTLPYGGGVLVDGVSGGSISNCVFLNDYGEYGGAVMFYQGYEIMTSCVFAGNQVTSGDWGNALFLYDWAPPEVFSNLVFVNNTGAAADGGAVAMQSGGLVTFQNCTFANNTAVTAAGAIYNFSNTGVTLIDDIFWGNSAPSSPVISGTSNAQYCDFQGGAIPSGVTDNGGNIYSDPLFVNAASPTGADNVYATPDDGLRLQSGSPCVNHGISTTGPTTDIIGYPRPYGNAPDMGAYEFDAGPSVSFAIASSTGLETTSSVNITVNLSAPAFAPVTVQYSLLNSGTAQPGTNYVAASGTLTFPVGVVSQTIPVTILHDFIDTDPAPPSAPVPLTLPITISAPTNATLGTITSFTYNIQNTDIAGFVFTPASALTGSLSTSELGGTATYTVALATKPSSASSNILINLSSSTLGTDYTGGTVSPAHLTFTQANWNLPQTVTVTGTNNGYHVVTGPVVYDINGANASTNDPDYDVLSVPSVPVTSIDADTAGLVITLNGESALNISAQGSSDTYRVHLMSQPIANVIVTPVSADGAASVSGPLTFTTTNWNVDQTVTVTGLLTASIENGMVGVITHTIASTDANYFNGVGTGHDDGLGIRAGTVTVDYSDSRTPGIVVTNSPVALTEGGAAGTYSVALATKPFIQAGQVAVVNTGGASSPTGFTGVGNTVYFTAIDATHGQELWKSDGTAGGTSLVVDLNPGIGSSYPQNLTATTNTLFFNAASDGSTFQLYGSTAGVTQVLAPFQAYNLVSTGSRLFFTGDDGTHGSQVWTSDGTLAGTGMVQDINPNADPFGLVLAGSTLYFMAYNGTAYSVYSTTGIGATVISGAAGTQDFQTPVYNPSINAIFFQGYDGTHGSEPWVLNVGTGNATIISDIAAGSNSSSPETFTVAGSKVYFTAMDNTSTWWLYVTDGTAGNTIQLCQGQITNALGTGAGHLIFSNSDSTHGQELWASDGTVAGSALVKDLWPGADSSAPANFISRNGEYLFTANDGSSGTELWHTDGTASGTYLRYIANGTGGNSPQNLAVVDNVLWFASDSGSGSQPAHEGQAVVTVSSTSADTTQLTVVAPGDAVFTSANYNIPQTIGLIAPDDNLYRLSPSVVNVTHGTASTGLNADPTYNNVSPLSTASANITVIDPAPTVAMQSASGNATASTSSQVNVNVVVTLSHVSGATTTVPFTLSGLVAGTDYNAAGSTASPLVIPAGAGTATITVALLPVTLYQPAKTLVVSLGTPTNASLGSPASDSISVASPVAKPQVVFTTASASQAETNGTPITVTAQLVPNTPTAVATVIPLNISGTAVNGTNYTTTAGSSLTIPAGSTSVSFTITPKDDHVFTANNTVIVAMGTPTNATAGSPSTFTLTIDEADTPPTVSFLTSSESVNESGQPTVSITVQLSANAGVNATIPFSFSGTAVGGRDYYSATSVMPAGGILTIPIGQSTGTISFQTEDDHLYEGTVTAIVNLGAPTNCTLGAITSHTVSIVDSQSAPTVQFDAATASVAENGAAISFHAVLSTVSGIATTVPFTITGTAINGTNYTISASSVTIPAGLSSAAITITPLDDLRYGPTTTVVATMGTPTNATPSGITQYTLSITNVDPPPYVRYSVATQSTTDTSATVAATVQLVNSGGALITSNVATSVNIGQSGGTAVSGTDYSTIAPTTVTIPAGSSTGTVVVTLLNNGLYGPTQTLALGLSGLSNGQLGTIPTDTISIANANPQPFVTFASPGGIISEGAGSTTVLVNLVNGSGTAITSRVATTVPLVTDASSTAGTSDATYATPVTIPAGSSSVSLPIAVIENHVADPSKVLVLDLQTPTNGQLGATTAYSLTIINDNSDGFSASPGTLAVKSTGFSQTSATYQVVLSAKPHAGETVTVKVDASADPNVTVNGGATASLLFTTANWNFAQTVTVTGAGTVSSPTLENVHNTIDTTVAGRDTGFDSLPDQVVAVTVSGAGSLIIVPSAGLSTLSEGGASATYAVTLTDAPITGVTIGISTDGVTQITSATSLSFTPANYNVAQIVTVVAPDDGKWEPVHTSTISHTVTSADTLYPLSDALPTVTATITGEASPEPTVSLSPATQNVFMGGPSGTVTVQLSAVSGADATVAYTASGTATSNYLLNPANQVVIPAGATSAAITVTGIDDGHYGPSQSLTITLGTVTDAIAAGSPAAISLLKMEPVPSVAFTTATGAIPDTGGTFTFTVTLSAVSDDVTTIPYSVDAASTAVSGTDFTLPGSQIVIPAGQISGTVVATIIHDPVYSLGRSLILDLGAPTNAALGAVTACNLAIGNTDAAPQVSFTSAAESANDNGGAVTVTVAMSAVSSVSASVPIIVTGTANAGFAYNITSSLPVVIPAGQSTGTITILPIDSNQYGPSTTVIATIDSANVVNCTANGTTVNTLTINNTNPEPVVSVQSATQSAVEAQGTIGIQVNLSTASQLSTSVPFVLSGTALAGTNYTLMTPSPLTFLPGTTSATILITLLDDHVYSNGYTLVATLGTPVNATLGAAVDTVAISEKDSAPTLQFTTATQSVSQTATTPVVATVTMSEAAATAVTVPFTVGGSATTPANYTLATSSPVTIPAGATSASITVDINNDDVAVNTTVDLTLGTPSLGLLGSTPSDVITIVAASTAGVTVSATSVAVVEASTLATYTVVLDSQPQANVTITPNPDVQVAVSPTSLLFTSANWNVPQVVTVNAPDDQIAEPAPDIVNITHTATSADAGYNGITVAPVAVTITQADVAGLTLTHAGTIQLVEGGASDTYILTLSSKPTGTVTLTLSPDAHLNVSPTTLTFDATTWNLANAAHTVTINAIDDQMVEASPFAASVSYSASGGGYTGISLSPTPVQVTNVDVAGFTATPNSGLTTTNTGGVALFTVQLTSKPSATVSLPLSTSDSSQGTVSPATLAFTAADWNLPHVVTITGTISQVATGDRTYTITASGAASADPFYPATVNMAPVSVTSISTITAGVTLTVPTTRPALFTVAPTSGTGAATVTLTGSGFTDATAVTMGGVSATIASVSATSVVVTAPPHAAGTVDIVVTVGGKQVTTQTVTSGFIYYTGAPPAPPSSTSPNSSHIAELGGSFIYTTVLTSQPTGPVTIGITVDQQVTLSATAVYFTPATWNVPQTVTVTAQDDLIAHNPALHSDVLVFAATGADYASISIPNLTYLVDDADTAGVTVAPLAGVSVIEPGSSSTAPSSATFTEVLTSQPIGNVSISLASSASAHVAVSPALLTFTPVNWNVSQTVTVTAIHDFQVLGTQSYSIISTPISSDPVYTGLSVSPEPVSVTDVDVAGITVTPVSGLITDNTGRSDHTQVVLASQPSADVVIALSSSDATTGSVSPAQLTFTSANWNVPQTVTASGVVTNVATGPVNWQIVFAAAVSTDSNYNNVVASPVAVLNNNNLAKGITTNVSSLTLTEGGAPGNFTVDLQSQPTGTVTITLGYDSTQLAPTPTTLTFTPANWNLPQPVSVATIDDHIARGLHAIPITLTPSGADYAAQPSATVTVSEIDADTAGLALTPVTGLTTSQAGATAAAAVRLTSEPLANVVLDLSTDNAALGSASPATVTFTPANWNTAQTVVITGQSDPSSPPTPPTASTYHLQAAIDGATVDTTYAALSGVAQVAVTSQPTLLVITQPGGATNLVEGGASGSYTIQLSTAPTGTVTVALSFTAALNVSPATLTFDATNWNQAQIVTVSAVHDFIAEGPHTASILHVASGGGYGSAYQPSVNVFITDIDSTGITLSSTAALVTTESGGSATATVVLTSEPSATGPVVLDLTSDNTGKGTVSPAQVTFTSANWNMPQNVVVTGVPLASVPGSLANPTTYHLVAAVDAAATGDAGYKVLAATPNLPVTSQPAGLVITPASATLNLTEGGSSGSYTIALLTQPSSTVAVAVTVDLSEIALSTSPTLYFTPANYSTAQVVTVSAIDDHIARGPHQSTITNTCSGGGYGTSYQPPVTVNITAIETTGLTLSSTSPLSTSESGGSATATLTLNSQPVAGDIVVIDLSSDNTAKGTVSPAQLTFTSTNWSQPQNIVVTGVPLSATPGSLAAASTYHLVAAVDTAATTDSGYQAFTTASNLPVTDQPAGLLITPASATLNLTEGGASGSYTISLSTQPSSTVAVTVGVTGALALSTGSTLYFTPANFSTGQVVTVSAVHDFVAQGPHQAMITDTASGGGYATSYQPPVTVNITDIDSTGITLSSTAALITTESGGSATATVVLTSKPVAGKTVILDLTSDATAKGTVSPAQITFDSTNWNVARNVVVTGVPLASTPSSLASASTYHLIAAVDGTTTDTGYLALGTTPNLPVTDQPAGLLITPASATLNLTEGGSSGSYTISLSTQPSATVAVTVGITSALALSTSQTLFFTPADYSTGQVVTVSAVHDNIAQGAHQATITDTSSGGGYGTAYQPPVTVNITDIDSTGIVLSSTAALVTTESGGSATATVTLNSQPVAGKIVVLDLTSDNTGKGTVSPAQITFNASNWNVGQNIVVTGVPLAAIPTTLAAATTYHLIAAVDAAATTDAGYLILAATPNLQVTSQPAGLLITQSGSGVTNLTEGAAPGTYTISLLTQPSATVSVTLGYDPSVLTLTTPTTLIFDPTDYATPQLVTAGAIHDLIAQGPHQATITASATGGGYDTAYQPSVLVNITDIDVASVVVSPILGLTTTTDGGAATFTVVLTSKPTGSVIIDFASSDPTKGTASPAAVTFDNTDWNVAQTVTVTGVPDVVPTVQPDSTYYVNGTIDGSSTDSVYRTKPVPQVTLNSHDPTQAGVTFMLSSTAALTTEGQGPNHSATYSVVLTARPQVQVSVAFSTSNAAVALVDPATANLVFDSTTWETPQIVVVNGNDDPHSFVTVATSTAYQLTAVTTSSDTNYNDISTSTTLTSIDHVLPSIAPSPGLYVNQRGGTAVVTTSVLSATQPDTADPGTLVYTLQLVPGQGNLTLQTATGAATLIVGSTFTQADVINGNVSFTHNGGTGGSDGFAVTATDADNGVSALAAVPITINLGRLPSVITLPTTTTTWNVQPVPGQPVLIDPQAGLVDTLDPDFPGGVLTVTVTGGGPFDAPNDDLGIFNQGTAAGQIGVNGNSVTYGGVPIGTIVQNGQGQPLVVDTNVSANPIGMTGLIEALTYANDTHWCTNAQRTVTVVFDNNTGGPSVPATAAVTVVAYDFTPTVANQTYVTPENVPVSGTVAMADDNIPPGASNPASYAVLTASLGQLPAKGDVTLNPDGTFTYVPAPGEFGTDTFTVVANDAFTLVPTDPLLTSAPGTVTVEITGGTTARPRIISNGPVALTVGDSLRYTVLTDLTDLPTTETPNLQFSLVGAPGGMTITPNTTNNTAIVQWTAAQPAVGTYVVFGIEVLDTVSNTSSYQQVTIVIAPVNGNG
jgi:ELWxxDGT repeat protein